MVKTDSRKVNQRRRLRRQKLENRARLRELKATPKVESQGLIKSRTRDRPCKPPQTGPAFFVDRRSAPNPAEGNVRSQL